MALEGLLRAGKCRAIGVSHYMVHEELHTGWDPTDAA